MKSYFESALPYLEVFYQPIYNLNEKKLNAAEALLRYDDGHHQNIEQVIRKARSCGMTEAEIRELFELILED